MPRLRRTNPSQPGWTRRRAGKGALLEGEDVWVTLEARPETRVPAPSLVVSERIAKLGPRRTQLSRSGRLYRGTYVLERVPRGRYAVEEARATIEDPFGLEREEVDLTTGGALLVYPRLVDLEATLAPGDKLVFFTDGVIEGRVAGGMLGVEGLERLLAGTEPKVGRLRSD